MVIFKGEWRTDVRYSETYDITYNIIIAANYVLSFNLLDLACKCGLIPCFARRKLPKAQEGGGWGGAYWASQHEKAARKAFRSRATRAPTVSRPRSRAHHR